MRSMQGRGSRRSCPFGRKSMALGKGFCECEPSRAGAAFRSTVLSWKEMASPMIRFCILLGVARALCSAEGCKACWSGCRAGIGLSRA